MAHRHTKGPKRGQCDNCPATKALARVEVALGVKLNLCVECRQALRKIQNERARQREEASEHLPEPEAAAAEA